MKGSIVKTNRVEEARGLLLLGMHARPQGRRAEALIWKRGDSAQGMRGLRVEGRRVWTAMGEGEGRGEGTQSVELEPQYARRVQGGGDMGVVGLTGGAEDGEGAEVLGELEKRQLVLMRDILRAENSSVLWELCGLGRWEGGFGKEIVVQGNSEEREGEGEKGWQSATFLQKVTETRREPFGSDQFLLVSEGSEGRAGREFGSKCVTAAFLRAKELWLHFGEDRRPLREVLRVLTVYGSQLADELSPTQVRACACVCMRVPVSFHALTSFCAD